jgi:hypothetical protein
MGEARGAKRTVGCQLWNRAFHRGVCGSPRVGGAGAAAFR